MWLLLIEAGSGEIWAGQGTWVAVAGGSHDVDKKKNQRDDYKFTNAPLPHPPELFGLFLTISGEENPQPIKYRVCVRHRNICEN